MKKIFSEFILTKTIVLIFITSYQLFPQFELRYPDIPADFITDLIFINPQEGFFINEGGSVYKTTDRGLSWKLKAHFQRSIFTKIKFLDEFIGFAISPHSHIGDTINLIKTIDKGESWTSQPIIMASALDFMPVSDDEFLKSNQVTIAWLDSSIERYNGFNWHVVYDMPRYWNGCLMASYGDIIQFQRLSDKILALGASHSARDQNIISDSVSFILQSKNNGYNWDTLWCKLPYVATSFYFVNDSVGWMGFEYNKIFKTTNGGFDWFEQFSDSNQQYQIKKIHATNQYNVYCVSNQGKIIYSTNGGNSWNVTQVGNENNSLSSVFFLNDLQGFIAGKEFHKTSDGGVTWERVSKSLKGNFWRIDFVDENYGMAVDIHVYKTTDGGFTWTIVRQAQNYCSSLDMIDRVNCWVTDGNLLLKTTDGGATWDTVFVDNDISMIRGVKFYKNIGILYEVVRSFNDSSFIYISTDSGNSWGKRPIMNLPFLTSYFKVKFSDDNHLWFINQQGVWLSKDTAKTWIFQPMIGSIYSAFDFADSLYGWFAVSDGQQRKLKFTTDGGNNWSDIDKPYSNQSMDLIIWGKDLSDKYNILVCGIDGSLFSYKQDNFLGNVENTFTNKSLFNISSYQNGNLVHIWVTGEGMTLLYGKFTTTDINQSEAPNLDQFNLYQNYPNPFNPGTRIGWQLPVGSWLTIKLYDIMGREIETIVNGYYEAGFHSTLYIVNSTLPSGVYFYQLKAGDFIQTKKMMVIK